jgi:hypothetical protein
MLQDGHFCLLSWHVTVRGPEASLGLKVRLHLLFSVYSISSVSLDTELLLFNFLIKDFKKNCCRRNRILALNFHFSLLVLLAMLSRFRRLRFSFWEVRGGSRP